MTVDETVREIKRLFRLSMNGIVSTSMRQRGVGYSLNFGLTRPMLKRIASRFDSDVRLAEALWQDRTREARLLAPILYPASLLTAERAEEWVRSIEYAEQADQCCMELFEQLPFARSLAVRWACRNEAWLPYTGFQLLIRLQMRQVDLSSDRLALEVRARELLDGQQGLALQTIVLNFLKRLLRAGKEPALETLSFFSDWKLSDNDFRRTIAEELQEEYDCFRTSDEQ